jgi:phosphate transport system substrate-binding protein
MKASRKLKLIILFVLTILLVCPSFVGSESVKMVFAGSGANLAITRILVDSFKRENPNIAIEVPESIGSTGGIKAAAEGAVTIGLASRRLKETEKTYGLAVVPYARTALVICAPPTVTDGDINFEELVQIYKGEKVKWKDGRQIIVLTRQPGDSLIETLERTIAGFKDAYQESQKTRRWFILFTDKDMSSAIAATPDSMGITTFGSVKSEKLKVKILNINGIYPSPENVSKGKYPLVLNLSFVFLRDRLPSGANAFISFVGSRKGETILRANGYLPGE